MVAFVWQWIPELQHFAPGIPVVLVGTKLGIFPFAMSVSIEIVVFVLAVNP